jgi:hypothetical protein
VGFAVAVFIRQTPQVDHRQVDRPGRSNQLLRSPVDNRNRRSQDLVARDNLIEGFSQRGHI